VRWYLRHGPSYRGIEADPVTIYRWAQRFTPELLDLAALT
jgi:transposase-like protein